MREISGKHYLLERPKPAISEVIARIYYQLEESDLSFLDYFEELGRHNGRTIRVFRADDVRVLLYCKVATLAGIEHIDDARFLDWGAQLAWETLMEREKVRDQMCAYHPNTKLLFTALMRE